MASRLSASPFIRALGLQPGWEPDGRLEHILEQMPAALLVFQRTRNILTANSAAVRLTGWTLDELAARLLDDLLAATPTNDTLAALDSLAPGSQRILPNILLRTRWQQVITVDARLSAFQDSGETILLVTATLASERLHQEREARQRDQVLAGLESLILLASQPGEATVAHAVARVRDMLDADAAGLYRLAPSAPELQLQFAEGVPDNFPARLGSGDVPDLRLPMQWSLGHTTPTRLLASVRGAGWVRFFAHPVGEGDTVGCLFVAYRPTRQPPAFAADLLAIAARQLDHLISLTAYQTHLADAQGLATRLASRLASIVAQVDEGILLLNCDGQIEEVNRAAMRMLGYRAPELIGLPCSDVLIADGELAEALRLTIGGSLARIQEGELRRRSGEAFPAAVSINPLPDCSCILVVRDLSQAKEKQLHQDLVDSWLDFSQSLQAVAHDVRAPLNVISLAAQFLEMRYAEDPVAQHHLGNITAEVQRLSAMIPAKLDNARPPDPKFAPLDLAALLQEVLSRWTSRVRRHNVRLNVFIAEELPLILGDKGLLQRVFVNLVENALQAMPAGGHLTLELRPLDQGNLGRFVQARVGDSGAGIPEEFRRRIFDPYFTTKPGGNGLGLAFCKRTISLHRGAIDFESFPGAGTIFNIKLPVYEAELPAPGAAE